ncbi:hypothetical protein ACFW04_008065 [Cataglyphis niger]
MKRAVYCVFIIAIMHFAMQEEVTKGVCNCAVSTVPATEPIIEHTFPCNVSCDQEGLEKCQQLCIALAETVRDQVPTLICEKLNTHVKKLKVALYMKSCDLSLWTFTGLESAEPICCHEGKEVACDEVMTIEN